MIIYPPLIRSKNFTARTLFRTQLVIRQSRSALSNPPKGGNWSPLTTTSIRESRRYPLGFNSSLAPAKLNPHHPSFVRSTALVRNEFGNVDNSLNQQATRSASNTHSSQHIQPKVEATEERCTCCTIGREESHRTCSAPWVISAGK